jgi:chaperonin GroEL (HSP60 family)
LVLCPHEGEIRIGGATEVEVKERKDRKDRKDRVDDAMHATRAAVEEGRAVASAC